MDGWDGIGSLVKIVMVIGKMRRKAHHLCAKVVVALHIWGPGLTF